MPTLQKDRILQHRGNNLIDRDGDKIGSIEEIYLDAETDEPEWALVNTGLFGTKQTFVPLGEASETEGGLAVPFEKSTVKDAPKIDPDGQLTQREEAELYRYYGMEYSSSGTTGPGTTGEATTAETTTGRTGNGGGAGTTGRDVSGPTTDDAMTRSEEELDVGTAQREAGRARLRKYVVTEEQTRTVPVRREEARIEREPITEDNRDAALSGPDISEEEHEVVLHAEEPVAEKRVVPKERVRLDKDTEVEEHTVSEDVRREEIDVDEGGRGTR
jgi:uncharacterized protein (TIGR02271 family)